MPTGEEIEAVRLDVTVDAIKLRSYRVTTVSSKLKPISLWLPKAVVYETDCFADGDEGYMVVDEAFCKKAGLID
jgi:hypothetical protein